MDDVTKSTGAQGPSECDCAGEELSMANRIKAIAMNRSLTVEERNRKMQELYSGKQIERQRSQNDVKSSDTIEAIEAALLEGTCKRVPKDSGLLRSCSHYDRQASIVSKCCSKIWPCRVCHDDAMGGEHSLDRHATELMVCRECGLVQPCAECCADSSCSFRKTKHFCAICRLWENKASLIPKLYHCDPCGLCRIKPEAGQEMRHCYTCNCCFSHKHFSEHHCLKSEEQVCPVCEESLTNSREPMVNLRCGHGIHRACLNSLHKTKQEAGGPYVPTQCPLCRKSIQLWGERESNQVKEELERHLMPRSVRHMIATIKCYDCSQTGDAAYHYLGNQCQTCSSWNTVVENIRKNPEYWREGATCPLGFEAEEQAYLEQYGMTGALLYEEGNNEDSYDDDGADNDDEDEYESPYHDDENYGDLD